MCCSRSCLKVLVAEQTDDRHPVKAPSTDLLAPRGVLIIVAFDRVTILICGAFLARSSGRRLSRAMAVMRQLERPLGKPEVAWPRYRRIAACAVLPLSLAIGTISSTPVRSSTGRESALVHPAPPPSLLIPLPLVGTEALSLQMIAASRLADSRPRATPYPHGLS